MAVIRHHGVQGKGVCHPFVCGAVRGGLPLKVKGFVVWLAYF